MNEGRLAAVENVSDNILQRDGKGISKEVLQKNIWNWYE